VQIVKKGVPIEARILAFVTLTIGLIQTVAVTISMLYNYSSVPQELSFLTLDGLHSFLGGIYFTNISGGITEHSWILAMGMVSIVIGLFMLRGYKLAWMANIALVGFRIVTLEQIPFSIYPIILNGMIIYLMLCPDTRRFFF
jgi:ABC-type sulfate transport system permease subunit